VNKTKRARGETSFTVGAAPTGAGFGGSFEIALGDGDADLVTDGEIHASPPSWPTTAQESPRTITCDALRTAHDRLRATCLADSDHVTREAGTQRRRQWGLLSVGLLLSMASIASCVHIEWYDPRDRAPSQSDDLRQLAASLRDDVEALAVDIGARNVRTAGSLDRSVAYLEDRIGDLGLTSVRETYVSSSWNDEVDESARNAEVTNLHFTLSGEGTKDGVVVVGAHYDTAWGTPGADDNASGCAALLAVATALRERKLARDVRFILFVNEEPPAFQRSDMGSLVAAQNLKRDGVRVAAMLSLESLGFYSDAPGSQDLPWPFSWIYPDTADYIFLIGDPGSASALDLATRTLRATSYVPVEAGGLPDVVPGVGYSDQWSFWQAGYPGIMVTDTAFMRNPHYHESTDLPPTLDFDRMASIVAGLIEVVDRLANETDD